MVARCSTYLALAVKAKRSRKRSTSQGISAVWNLNFTQVDAVTKEINLTQLEVWQDHDLHVTSALPILGHEEQSLGSKMTP